MSTGRQVIMSRPAPPLLAPNLPIANGQQQMLANIYAGPYYAYSNGGPSGQSGVGHQSISQARPLAPVPGLTPILPAPMDDTASNSGEYDGPRKRKQVKNACVNCQKACKKCDNIRPCPRCVRYGLSDSCIDSVRKERRKGIKRGPYKPKLSRSASVANGSSRASDSESSSRAPSPEYVGDDNLASLSSPPADGLPNITLSVVPPRQPPSVDVSKASDSTKSKPSPAVATSSQNMPAPPVFTPMPIRPHPPSTSGSRLLPIAGTDPTHPPLNEQPTAQIAGKKRRATIVLTKRGRKKKLVADGPSGAKAAPVMALAPAPSTEKGDWRKPVSTSAPQSPSQAFLTRMPEAPAGNDEHVKMQPVGSPMEDVVMNRPLAVAPAPIPDPAKTAKEIEDDHWSKLHILSQLCSAVLDHSTKDGDEPARDQEEAATLASMSQKPATLDVPHRQHSASLQTRQQARSEKQLNSGAPRQVSPAILPRTRKSKKQAALSTATVDESSSLSHVSASIPSTNEDQGVAALLSIATISAAASPLPPITSPHHPHPQLPVTHNEDVARYKFSVSPTTSGPSEMRLKRHPEDAIVSVTPQDSPQRKSTRDSRSGGAESSLSMVAINIAAYEGKEAESISPSSLPSSDAEADESTVVDASPPLLHPSGSTLLVSPEASPKGVGKDRKKANEKAEEDVEEEVDSGMGARPCSPPASAPPSTSQSPAVHKTVGGVVAKVGEA